MLHNPLGPICTAASIHLAAAVPNFDTLEDRTREGLVYSKEQFPIQPTLEGDHYTLPTGPGLGVEFNEEAAGEPFEFWEAPHLHRRDGSSTNW